MAWTQSDLEKLEQALAQGASMVVFSDRTVQYRSVGDLLKAIDVVRRALGTEPKQTIVVPKR